MKKAFLIVGMGTLFALGACADNDKKVTPASSLKTTDSTSTGGQIGASRNNIVPAADPSAGTSTGAGMGSADSTMTTGSPGMGYADGAGTGISHAGTPTHASTTHRTSTTGGTKVASASTGSTKAVATSAHGKKYTVKKGDTLSAIAKKYYGKTSAIKKIVAANPGMNPDKIRIGQVINLPA